MASLSVPVSGRGANVGNAVRPVIGGEEEPPSNVRGIFERFVLIRTANGGDAGMRR
jgi:hypothetical protein